MLRLRLAVLVLALIGPVSASAYDWGQLAAISSTMGVNDGRLCLGEGSRGDLGCPTYAPYVSNSGFLGIGTSAPAAELHVHDAGGSTTDLRMSNSSSGFTSADGLNLRMSGSDASLMNYESGFYSIGTAGAERLRIVSGGQIGVATIAPSTSLHVSGTLRIANGGEACDANRAGGIRYNSGTFEFCAGSAWQSLAAVAGSGSSTATDRISTTGVASGATLGMVVADKGTISFTLGGTAGAAYLHPSLGLVAAGVSTTGPISGTAGYFSGNVGIGKSPQAMLDVLGQVSASSFYLGADNQLKGGNASQFMQIQTTDGDINFSSVGDVTVNLDSDNNSADLHGFRVYKNATDESGPFLFGVNESGSVGVGSLSPNVSLTVVGEVQVSSSGIACSSANTGAMRYDDATKKFLLCRGTP